MEKALLGAQGAPSLTGEKHPETDHRLYLETQPQEGTNQCCRVPLRCELCAKACLRNAPPCPVTVPQRLLPAPPNGVSPPSHTQVGGWTVDPVCLLSSLCSHLHGDSAPSGAGQPAQVSHPPLPQPPNPWRSLASGRFFEGGISRILILHPFLLYRRAPFSGNSYAFYSPPNCLIPTSTSPNALRKEIFKEEYCFKRNFWILFSFKQEYHPHSHPIGSQESLIPYIESHHPPEGL